MNDHEKIIQKYFDNTLSDEEQAVFDTRLKTDPKFAELVQSHEDIAIAFQIQEDQEVSALIKEIEHKRNNKPFFLKIAAAIAMFITGYYFLFNSSANYESYLETYPNVYHPITRGNSESKLDEAFNAYESEAYETAVKKFDELLADEKTPEIEFYKAMALLNNKKYNDAFTILSQLQQTSFDYQEETLWYLTVISLLNKKEQEAKTYLKFMENNAMKYKLKEREILLKKLN